MAKEKTETTWTGSKSEFILAYDTSVPAAQVVEEAKSHGLKISAGYVYTLRSQAQKKNGTATAVPKRGRRRAQAQSPSNGSNGTSSAADKAFKKAVAHIGTVRARTIIDEIEKTIDSV